MPGILNCKKVVKSVPSFLDDPPLLLVIAGRIFNNRRVVEELDVDTSTEGMECSCSSYEEPSGHVWSVVVHAAPMSTNTYMSLLVMYGDLNITRRETQETDKEGPNLQRTE